MSGLECVTTDAKITFFIKKFSVLPLYLYLSLLVPYFNYLISIVNTSLMQFRNNTKRMSVE